jgi:hypothetical protein
MSRSEVEDRYHDIFQNRMDLRNVDGFTGLDKQLADSANGREMPAKHDRLRYLILSCELMVCLSIGVRYSQISFGAKHPLDVSTRRVRIFRVLV